MTSDAIVAVGLLTQADLDRYGAGLKRVFTVQDTPCFTELLRVLDEADREHWPAEDRLEALRQIRTNRE